MGCVVLSLGQIEVGKGKTSGRKPARTGMGRQRARRYW